MGVTSFAREYLNIWPRLDDTVIPADAWMACQDPDLVIPDGAVFTVGFDVNYSRTAAAIAIAARVGDRTVVEVTDAGLSTAALVPRLVALGTRYRATILAAPAQAGVVADLTGRGITTRLLSGREYQAACQTLYDAATSHRLAHRGQPDLDGAVAAAGRSRAGDAWAWSHRNSAAPIDPLVAATLAVAGVGSAKPLAVWAV
jgi:phage terminase large subunit-like protein